MSNVQSRNELQAALDQVSRCLNAMGDERAKQEAVKEWFMREHRTLQQSFFRVVIMSVLGTLDVFWTTDRTDLRNQAAADMAHKMLSAIPENERYIPLV